MISVTKLFYLNDLAFKEDRFPIIHRGGTSSSKTFSNLQTIINHAFEVEDKVFSITAESIPHLDRGAIRDSKKIIKQQNLTKLVKFNETKRFFTLPNNVIIEFFSADREDIAVGARRYLLYGNEINYFKKEIWEEFARRSEKIIADFNPTAKFWLEDWLEYYPKNVVIKSNYLDNEFVPQHEKERIKLRAEKDDNFRRVHIDCEYGSTEDLVFKPEQIILIDEFPRDLKFNYGLDFGFVAPSCLVKASLVEDELYIEEMFYQRGLSTHALCNLVREKAGNVRIYADSEDKRMVYEMQNMGINVESAVKGGVVEGVSFLQGLKIYITKNSINGIKEFRELRHEKNKQGVFTGNYLGDDHFLDSSRYALQPQKTNNKQIQSSTGSSTNVSYRDTYGSKR